MIHEQNCEFHDFHEFQFFRKIDDNHKPKFTIIYHIASINQSSFFLTSHWTSARHVNVTKYIYVIYRLRGPDGGKPDRGHGIESCRAGCLHLKNINVSLSLQTQSSSLAILLLLEVTIAREVLPC